MRVSILDSCQERFLWTHKEVGFAPHPVVGLVLQVGETEKFPPALCFESLDPFFSVRKQGSCFTTIEEDVQVDEALIFLSSFSVAFREEKRERGRYIYFHFIFSGLTLLGAARFFDLGIFALPGPDQERKSLPELIQEDFDNFRKLMTRSSSSENGSENKDDT